MMGRISKSRLMVLDRVHRRWSSSRIAQYQLERINSLWKWSVQNIPYYQNLTKQFNLPKAFDSLRQYMAVMPPLTREVFQDRSILYWHQNPRPNRKRITGGSTAMPIQIPTWKTEYDENREDAWLARSWYGIDPGDRLLLYWGHAHLLGEGWRRVLNGYIRSIKDRIQNYKRYSCYDMSDSALRKAGDYLVKSNAHFIIGYSCYLDRLSRINSHLSSAIAGLGLKAVIGAAEGFPFEDSKTRIENTFHAPLGMEYGSVETGLIAHTHPTGGYRVLWNSYLLEYAAGSALQEVFVTSLFRRCTPLFRYKLNDLYEVGDRFRLAANCSTLSFDRVVGRSNSFVVLPAGRILHSEAVSHVVRSVPKITGYQFVCWRDRTSLRVTTNEPLNVDDVQKIRNMARQVDPQFGEVLNVAEVRSLTHSVAGKTPMILIKDEPYEVVPENWTGC